jgi:hypothetical protein
VTFPDGLVVRQADNVLQRVFDHDDQAAAV